MNVRFGLGGRLVGSYLLLATVGLGVFVLRYGWISQDALVGELQRNQHTHAVIIGASLVPSMEAFVRGSLSPDVLEQLVDRLAEGAAARVTLLDGQGDPLYDSQREAAQLSNQWQEVEVQTALAGAAEYDIRADASGDDERLYVAAPVRKDGQVLGVVQLSVPTGALRDRIKEAWLSLFWTALAAILASAVTSLLLARGILRPLEALRRTTRQMAAGNLDQRIVVERDDELGDLTRAINAMAARVQNLVQQQKDFVANASHQLRTPLTTVKLRVEALMGGARNDTDVATRFLVEIESEIDRLGHLVDELLTLARVEAGIETLKKERVNLALLLGKTVAAFYPRAECSGVTMTLDALPNLPSVLGSPEHIRQVMDNLMDNALKHTPAGGLIAVACRTINGQLSVIVTDTGHGIPAADLPYVFNRFYRSKAHGRVSGSGLGLAIVRSIVEAHGGEVSVESQEGKGTSVRFTLPLMAR